jgi:hypothetical protein
MFELMTLSAVILDIELFNGVENAIAAGIGIFSLLLLALSITAFKKTGLRITIYAIIIFALFAIQQLFDYSENIFPELDTPVTGVLVDSLTLAILVLFFLAIKNKELVKSQYVCHKYSIVVIHRTVATYSNNLRRWTWILI